MLQKYMNTAFLLETIINTRSTIAFKDVLQSMLAPEIALICLTLAARIGQMPFESNMDHFHLWTSKKL